MLLESPKEAARYLRRVMRLDVEEFWALGLNANKDLVEAQCLFRGTVDACGFHARDVFRFACRVNASSILVAHNHPSGVKLPSGHDERITRKLVRAASLLEIKLEDHLIVTEGDVFSFREAGLIN